MIFIKESLKKIRQGIPGGISKWNYEGFFTSIPKGIYEKMSNKITVTISREVLGRTAGEMFERIQWKFLKKNSKEIHDGFRMKLLKKPLEGYLT